MTALHLVIRQAISAASVLGVMAATFWLVFSFPAALLIAVPIILVVAIKVAD